MTETLDDVSARTKPADESAEQQAAAEGGADNIRNGTRTKTVLTEHSGHVEIEVPRDRAATFEPQTVRTRQPRLAGVDEIVVSLYAKGLTTPEIGQPRRHLQAIHGRGLTDLNELANPSGTVSTCALSICPRWWAPCAVDHSAGRVALGGSRNKLAVVPA